MEWEGMIDSCDVVEWLSNDTLVTYQVISYTRIMVCFQLPDTETGVKYPLAHTLSVYISPNYLTYMVMSYKNFP